MLRNVYFEKSSGFFLASKHKVITRYTTFQNIEIVIEILNLFIYFLCFEKLVLLFSKDTLTDTLTLTESYSEYFCFVTKNTVHKNFLLIKECCK